MKKIILLITLVLLLTGGIGGYSLYREVFILSAQNAERITFVVKPGESVTALATRLEEEKIIRSSSIFKLYVQLKNIDKNIRAGSYVVTGPLTLTKVAGALWYSAGTEEREITIIPGWDLRDIADYFEKEEIASSTEFFALTGNPGVFNRATSTLEEQFSLLTNKPNVSLEGYLSPETYRIYKNEKLESILKRFLSQREKELSLEMLQEIKKQGKTPHEILTLASIVEKEVKLPEDRKKVADLFWRRIKMGWGLQADSTVHYLSGREGDVFTKEKERQIDSLWNTYKYRDLPPGPISNPSITSIEAVVYPEKNDDWYFLTTKEGDVKYGKTLEEHNANVYKYLR